MPSSRAFSSRSAGGSSSSSAGSDSDDDDSRALQATITALNSALSAFEHAHVRPLLARPLKDSLAAVGDGEEVDKAKLLVTLGYVIEDLVWSQSRPPALARSCPPDALADRPLPPGAPVAVYLKTKGIQPESHPVVPELQRIKSYFTKIQDAVDPPKRAPPSPPASRPRPPSPALTDPSLLSEPTLTPGTMVVDRPAAARFIRSALAANGKAEDRSGADDIGMQTRFNVLKHQEAILRADPVGESSGSSDDDDDEVLEVDGVIGGSGPSSSASPAKRSLIPPAPRSKRPSASAAAVAKGKGKAKAALTHAQGGSATSDGSYDSDVVVIDAGEREKAAVGGSSAGGEKRASAAKAPAEGKSKRAKMDPFAGELPPAARTLPD